MPHPDQTSPLLLIDAINSELRSLESGLDILYAAGCANGRTELAPDTIADFAHMLHGKAGHTRDLVKTLQEQLHGSLSRSPVHPGRRRTR